MPSSVAVINGPHLSFLDHLIPLCDLFDIPLYAPDLIETFYYPKVHLADSLEGYDSYFSVEPYKLHPEAFLMGSQLISEKKISICGFHGNSNKCRNAFWAERFMNEDIVLFYGNYMADFFKEKGVLQRIKKPLFCGNYRWHYYQKYKEHFHTKLPGSGQKVLYAPTWSYQDATDDSPFLHCHRRLLDHVPREFTLFVKLHPYMYLLHREKIQEIQERYQENERVHFLPNTPCIYPLLEQIDIYIGDYSSVAYDFLAFDRPLFFLADKVDPYLLKCGHQIKEGEIFSQLEKKGDSLERQGLYAYCFADLSLEELRQNVEEGLHAY